MLLQKPLKIKRPSPIWLIDSSRRKRAFGLIFFGFLITVFRKKILRTADVVVMLYAMLSFITFTNP